MDEYEIRVLGDQGRVSMIHPEVHLGDASAIKAARKIAAGHAFEVWRGIECIFTSQAERRQQSPAGRGSRV